MVMTGTLLSVRDVSKNFGDVEALKSVTLDLNRGDVVGLVGGNGAGKTTLHQTVKESAQCLAFFSYH